MKNYFNALAAEFLKVKNSKIIWISFLAFSLAPIMGGVFMIILSNPELAQQSTALNAKAELMSVEYNWNSYLSVLCQAMGIGGIMVFGFVISWLFGREYSDGTAKDLLSLPVSRTTILNAKFIVYIFWCLALAISNLLTGLIIGNVLQLPVFIMSGFMEFLQTYFMTTLLTILIGTPVAFFALAGKGYLTPLGFVALTLVFAQIIAAIGYGHYFPWSVPGIYSNNAGGSLRALLNYNSYLILVATAVIGYMLTIAWWNFADQN